MIRSGPAATASRSGGPDASMATLTPASRHRRTSPAYRSSSTPGGRLPEPTSQLGCSASVSTAPARSASNSALDSSGPDSLILVVVPSGSTRARLVRIEPPIGTIATAMPASCRSSASRCPCGPPAGRTASVRALCAVRAREMFTPLPPGSSRLPVARCTSPRCRSVMDTVRSRLGFGVRVTIMRAPPQAQEPQSRQRSQGRARRQ